MKFLVKPKKAYEYGFCNNSGCKRNACNSYTNSSCTGDVDCDIEVSV